MNSSGIRRKGNPHPWTGQTAKVFYWSHCPGAKLAPRVPLTRKDCPEMPCPYMSCRYHLAPQALAAAERNFKNPDNRKIPVGWGKEISEGDFSSLPYTCVLDLVESRGQVIEGEPFYDGMADGEAIGGYLGLSREMVRLNCMSGIANVMKQNRRIGEMLLDWYNRSKEGGQRK